MCVININQSNVDVILYVYTMYIIIYFLYLYCDGIIHTHTKINI